MVTHNKKMGKARKLIKMMSYPQKENAQQMKDKQPLMVSILQEVKRELHLKENLA